MPEVLNNEPLTNFDFEPLVVAERIGYHPEWLVTEGLVSGVDGLEGPIWLPRIVAASLERANEQLGVVSERLNRQLGCFGEPLGIYLLAGKREPEANALIAKELQRLRYPPTVDCLRRADAHTSGREVDVALVYKNSGRLLNGYCYGMYYYSGKQPLTFKDALNLEPVQSDWAYLLLVNAMKKQGFVNASFYGRWHFTYKGDR